MSEQNSIPGAPQAWRPDMLTIAVPEVVPVRVSELAEPGLRQHAVPAGEDVGESAVESYLASGDTGGWFHKLTHRTTDIDLQPVRHKLDAVESQIGQLFDGIWTRPTAGMHLTQVQVSLTLTAEGGIGIATVGSQVAFALTYERGANASSQ